MSANTDTRHLLVAGGLPEDQAAALLARLRREIGDEFARGLRHAAHAKYGPDPELPAARTRRRKAKHGAWTAAADWVAEASASGLRLTIPEQRDTGSTNS